MQEPAPDDSQATVLELDELWSFVCRRANKRWIWIALCRATRQVVAFVIGDRSARTCQKLWAAISPSYQAAHCYTDFWEACQQVIPEERHTAGGKDSGDRARRTLEQYFATTAGALCAADLVFFQIGPDARDLFALVSSSLQSLVCLAWLSHYPLFICGSTNVEKV